MKERWIGQVSPPPLAEGELEAIAGELLPGVGRSALQPTTGGFRNHNFVVREPRQPLRLLRIYPAGSASIARKEQAIARRLAGRVRTPEHLRCEIVGERPVSVRRFEPGIPLHEALARDGAQADAGLGRSVGETLAAIHSVAVAGHGDVDGELRVVEPRDLSPRGLGGYVADLCATARVRERVGGALADATARFWERDGARLAEWMRPAILTHCDFGPTNLILRDDGQLVVIDWEFASGGGPAFDFGNLLRPPLEGRGEFLRGLERGYRDRGGWLPDDFAELARLADVICWLQFASRSVCHERVATDARERLGGVVARAGWRV